jgi:DinB superfamily
MTDEDLKHPSDGTKWTNRELLFHMLFGYLLAQALIPLVKVLGLLPEPFTKPFAWLLNSLTRPFNVVNYWGSRLGARGFDPGRLKATLDKICAKLRRKLAAESASNLRRGMHYPTKWDPFFADYMTLADIYHYPTQHFEFHRTQLALAGHKQG